MPHEVFEYHLSYIGIICVAALKSLPLIVVSVIILNLSSVWCIHSFISVVCAACSMVVGAMQRVGCSDLLLFGAAAMKVCNLALAYIIYMGKLVNLAENLFRRFV